MPTVDGIESSAITGSLRHRKSTGTMQLTIKRVDVRHVLHAIHLVEKNRNVIVSNCHLYENRGGALSRQRRLAPDQRHRLPHQLYNAAGGIVSRAGKRPQPDARRLRHRSQHDGRRTAHGKRPDRLHGSNTGTAEVAVTGLHHPAQPRKPVGNVATSAPARRRAELGHVCLSGNVLSDVAVTSISNSHAESASSATHSERLEHNLRVTDRLEHPVGRTSSTATPDTRTSARPANGTSSATAGIAP